MLLSLISHCFFSLSSTIEKTNEDDELLAIELEISEIDEEIQRLRFKRSQLVLRQEQVKNSLKEDQRTTTDTNSIQQWQRTGP